VWKTISSFTPGAALTFVNAWLAPFQKLTIFSNPDWQQIGDNSAVAVSVFIAAVVSIVCRNSARPRLLLAVRTCLILTFIFLVACAGFHFYLSYPYPRPQVEILELIWLGTYVLMIGSMITTVVFTALLVQS
jgi:hypothetical protein